MSTVILVGSIIRQSSRTGCDLLEKLRAVPQLAHRKISGIHVLTRIADIPKQLRISSGSVKVFTFPSCVAGTALDPRRARTLSFHPAFQEKCARNRTSREPGGRAGYCSFQNAPRLPA